MPGHGSVHTVYVPGHVDSIAFVRLLLVCLESVSSGLELDLSETLFCLIYDIADMGSVDPIASVLLIHVCSCCEMSN